MFLKKPDLTAGSRPLLQQDETLLFVQNAVGLYEGKFKIADCQDGHAYLTSHRVYYIDDQSPRQNSLAVDLKDVDRTDFQAGFLRSSAKITIHPKPLRRGLGSVRQSTPLAQGVQRVQQSSSSPGTRSSSPFRASSVSRVTPALSTGNWVCPICSFNNPVPSNFDPAVATEAFPIPPCLTCGIKPPFALILKAAISAGSSRPSEEPPTSPSSNTNHADPRRQSFSAEPQSLVCPRCTFHNHPSLQMCEMCGASLPVTKQANAFEDLKNNRSASPAPVITHISNSDDPVSIKLSFRTGGDKVFYERLKSAMVQRKWLTANAPPIPKPLDNVRKSDPGSPVITGAESRPSPRSSRVGIAGLEQLGKQTQKDNELVIGSAFEDLESLMALDKEVSALAQKIAREFGNDAANSTSFGSDDLLDVAEPGMIATKDMLSTSSEKIYISELARNLAEFVTDERRALLRKRGGTMSLVDLWATFNRARNGVELVSPDDFHKAASMWAALGLPVRLKQFKSGLLAVQRLDMSDDRVVDQLQRWLESFRHATSSAASGNMSAPGSPLDHTAATTTSTLAPAPSRYGCGVTALDAAKKFGWSLGIATEELEMAEERGILVREESIEGLKFWLNFFGEPDNEDGGSDGDGVDA